MDGVLLKLKAVDGDDLQVIAGALQDAIVPVLDIAYDHEGAIQNMEGMTRHRARLASSLFHNWPVVEEEFPVNTAYYRGEYLFTNCHFGGEKSLWLIDFAKIVLVCFCI